jgi:hypothetical protein
MFQGCEIHFFIINFVVVIIFIEALWAGHEQVNSQNSLKHFSDDMSGPLSPMSVPAQKQLKYTPGIANGSVRESVAFRDQTRKVNLLILQFFICNMLSSLAKKVGFIVGADGTIRAVINEKVGSCGTCWEALEVEEKSSPVAITI